MSGSPLVSVAGPHRLTPTQSGPPGAIVQGVKASIAMQQLPVDGQPVRVLVVVRQYVPHVVGVMQRVAAVKPAGPVHA